MFIIQLMKDFVFLSKNKEPIMKEINKHNATKEEIINTCEETFGKKNYHETYNSQSEGRVQDSFYAPEEWGTWQTETEEITLKKCIRLLHFHIDWSIKMETTQNLPLRV